MISLQVSKEDVARLRAQLQAIPIPNFTPGQSSNTNFTDVTRTQFFRIPFTQVNTMNSLQR